MLGIMVDHKMDFCTSGYSVAWYDGIDLRLTLCPSAPFRHDGLSVIRTHYLNFLCMTFQQSHLDNSNKIPFPYVICPFI